MIIYLHGFDATSPGNHEKVMQLKSIDQDVRSVHYSTIHPKQDMSHILKEVHQHIKSTDDSSPLICGVGLGGYWSERIGFLCGIKQVIFNPNLHPEDNMVGRIEWPEEYFDIDTKCVSDFRRENESKCLCILSTVDDVLDSEVSNHELANYYPIIFDQNQGHKFTDIAVHLTTISKFKTDK
ncbi:alpha/beta hydrolase YcfP [Psychromonas sp. L1A2]|uniref:alpha/beta hydrolase YcfP n=1 Tax=Psychromonas sp. L1A2 TaxID=2686356 RepID=UPI001356B1EA|nr:alpha/beta hydrolase YcfP [Psychromonas sp. L1A2]